MTDDDLEARLRRGFDQPLPAAPSSLRLGIDALPVQAPIHVRGTRGSRSVLAAALLGALLVGVVAMALTRDQASIAPGTTPSPTAPPTSSATSNATPTPDNQVDGLTILSVSDVLEGRSSGEIGGQPFALRGYWTGVLYAHSCAPPSEQPGDLEIYCHDGEFGITEQDEPFITVTVDSRAIPHSGPGITPYVREPEATRLYSAPGIVNGQPYPPVPIVVIGHFDDPEAADCRPQARQICLDRFVLDQIVEFDPQAVPTPGVTPSPTPFPFADPPPAPFTADRCSGDVPYSFVGWGRLADFGLDRGDPDTTYYIMVTRDEVDLGSPGGPRGRRICFAPEWDHSGLESDELPEP